MIASSERDHLFHVVLLELGRGGSGALSIADVLPAAGISQAAFEAEFEDLDSCLFAAFDQLTEKLAKAAGTGCDIDGEWRERVQAGLEALLEELAAQPDMARALTCSFPAIGPAAQLRYTELLESFTPLLRGGRALSAVKSEPPGELEMLAIGAAEAIVREEIQAGRAAQLPAMSATILFALLAPFLGVEHVLATVTGETGPRGGGS
ncbi:MAG: hypothetical protein WA862_08920 [Solirubrobacterales bacterium]